MSGPFSPPETTLGPDTATEPDFGQRIRRAVIWRSGSQIAGQIVAWASTFLVIRILTPPGMRYEDAYARFHPFDRLMEIPESAIKETAQIVRELSSEGTEVLVTVNNRAGGNAPEILRQLAVGMDSTLEKA